MNKRIQELAEQCHHRYSEHNIDLEKFAKLIVQECAGIYDKIDNGNQHMGTDNYLEALQKHFGVEE